MLLVEVFEIWQGLDLFRAVDVFKFALFSRIAFSVRISLTISGFYLGA